eukprot:TRINITY_DN554_c1_g1_i2.p1 TRINITY_DN554_c1_g1~~TRINITY_DN554_c1_g1_i2.p1  ORF type:complete len:102 (-),score=22.87 TRINITY_DN554_c1_g1_i2:74-379(-)
MRGIPSVWLLTTLAKSTRREKTKCSSNTITLLLPESTTNRRPCESKATSQGELKRQSLVFPKSISTKPALNVFVSQRVTVFASKSATARTPSLDAEMPCKL